MPTQNVNLTDHQSQFIRKCVESGRFQNASEVVRDALRMLEQRDEEYQLKLEALKAELQKGFDAIRDGDYIDLNSPEEISAYFESARIRRRERLEALRHGTETPKD